MLQPLIRSVQISLMTQHPANGNEGEPGEHPLKRMQKLLDVSDLLMEGVPMPDPDSALFQNFMKIMIKQREAEALLRKVEQGALVKFHRALDVRSQIVTHPNHAKTFVKRHNDQVISGRIATDIFRFVQTKKISYLDDLQEIQKYVNEFGMFLLLLNEAEMQKRISEYYPSRTDQINPHYLITEVGGRHPDEKTGVFHEPGIWAADCQMHLPNPVPNSTSVLPLPNENDEILEPTFVEEHMKNPHNAALVEDIVCHKDMSGLSMASHALHIALVEIISKINPARPDFPIANIGAGIASVRGLSIDGEDRLLGEGMLKDIAPIGNGRSFYLFDHFQSTLAGHFSTAYILKDRRYPIVIRTSDKEYHCELIVNWYHKVCRLKTSS